jgi:hypothetical protein
MESLPEVPTVAEVGYKDREVENWFGLLGDEFLQIGRLWWAVAVLVHLSSPAQIQLVFFSAHTPNTANIPADLGFPRCISCLSLSYC